MANPTFMAIAGIEDGGVDADDLAVEVEERAARVALVDGGVGLDEVLVADRPRRFSPMTRFLALTMPMVTVCPRPSGLPMAST